MTTVEISGNELVLNVEGLDRFWSLKSELRLPVSHVVGVEPAADEAGHWWHGLRLLGTHVPGLITAGTFVEHDGRVFWDVHDPKGAIAIRLRDDRFVKLVVEVVDPAATCAALTAAIANV